LGTERISRAVFWGSAGIIGKQAIIFIVGILLARILEPSDFGLIGMILVFSNLGSVIIDFGFGKAIIQSRDINQADLSTIFFFNLLLGLILAVLFFLASDLIARFYNETELTNLIRFISLIFVFYSISLVQRSLFLKKIDFRSESIIIISAAFISGGVAIAMAMRGHGVWSLAWRLVLNVFIESLLLWAFSKWFPGLIIRFSSLRKFLGFSMNMFGAGLLNFLSQNLDKLMIGKLFSASILGYFDCAKQFSAFLQDSFGRILGKVMFPVLSERQDQTQDFLLVYRKSIILSALFFIPLFFSLVLISEPLIVILITEKWLPSVPILQILAVSGFTVPLSTIMVNAIAAKGSANLVLRIGIIKNIFYFTGILVGSIWSILGVAIAIVLARYISLFINMFFASKLLKISLLDQLNDLKYAFLFSLVIFASLFFISVRIELSTYIHLFGLPLFGAIIYLILIYVFLPEAVKVFRKVLGGLLSNLSSR